MKTLYVELGDRRYPIHIGPGLLGRPELLRPIFLVGGCWWSAIPRSRRCISNGLAPR